jgi:hypothetical protein
MAGKFGGGRWVPVVTSSLLALFEFAFAQEFEFLRAYTDAVLQ